MERAFLNQILITVCLSSAIMSSLSLIFEGGYLTEDNARRVFILWGAEIDPNNQAAFSLFSYVISLYAINKVKTKWKIVLILFAVVSLISILNTASRGAFISLIVSSSLLLLNTLHTTGIQKKATTYIMAIIAILTIAYIVTNASLYINEQAYERVFQEDYGDGSKRSFIWQNVYNIFSSSILYIIFGMGWGTANIYTGETYGSYYSIHNTHFAILTNTGIIGFLLFYYPLYKVIKSLYSKRLFLPIILFLSQFIVAFFLECINKRFFWNAIFIIFIADTLQCVEEGENDIQTENKTLEQSNM